MEKLLPMEAKDKVGGILQIQYVQAKSLEELQQKALAKVITNTAEIKKKQEEFQMQTEKILAEQAREVQRRKIEMEKRDQERREF